MKCTYCELVEGKRPARKVYEDSTLLAILVPKPAALGHILIVPKAHKQIITQLDDNLVARLWSVSQKLTGVLFDLLAPGGTNIIIQNGAAAGQTIAHFGVHIIPRTEGDGLGWVWQPKAITEEVLDQLHGLLKVPVSEEKRPEKVKELMELKKVEPEELLKQLKRIP